MWLWGPEVKEYVKEKTRGVRTKAAEGARAAAEKVGWSQGDEERPAES
jgi:hypothetical protein